MTAEKDLEHLVKIARFEETANMGEFRMGWTWRHVVLEGAILHHLFLKGYLDLMRHSGAFNGYHLSDLGKALVKSYREEATANSEAPRQIDISDDIFSDIIGHDDVKELLKACLLAEKPVHVLLTGPPALAKSLFLWDIERIAGEKAIWLVGSATSKAGLWDLVAERRPGILLIDELDKMNAADTAALLSMMEGGRLVRAKKGRHLDLSHQLRVVAASNHLDKLSPELRSRFVIRTLTAYNRSDYLAVVKGVLVRREGLSQETADKVACGLDGLSQDVRDAIHVARLVPQLGVKRAIELVLEER